MTYQNMDLCAERCSSILESLLEAGCSAKEPLLSAQASLDHARGNFYGAQRLVEEEHHSERACGICVRAGFALGEEILGALDAIECAVYDANKAGKGAADAK